MNYMSPRQIKAKYDLSTYTLIAWEKKGLITSIRTAGNHRRYLTTSIEKALGQIGENK